MSGTSGYYADVPKFINKFVLLLAKVCCCVVNAFNLSNFHRYLGT